MNIVLVAACTTKQSKVERKLNLTRNDRGTLCCMSGHEHNFRIMGGLVPGAIFQVFSQCLTRLTRTLCNLWISWFDVILNTVRGVLKDQKEDC